MRKGQKHTKEAKEKMRLAKLGTRKPREELERRTSTRWRKNNYEYWHSPETVEKIRKKATGRKLSQGTKNKIADSVRRTMGSIEWRAEINERNPFWRRGPISPEHRRNIREGVIRSIEKRKREEEAAVVEEEVISDEVVDTLSEVRGSIQRKKERRRLDRGY